MALALGDYLKVRAHACIGGTSIQEDKDKLRDGQHLVVGTPGRRGAAFVETYADFDPRYTKGYM